MNKKAESTALVQLDAATKALALATSLDTVKDVRDKAEAVRVYLRQQRGSHEAQNYAAKLKLRAERRLGELLADGVGHNGGRPAKRSHDATVSNGQIPEGISRDQSSRWQRIASVPEERFEAYLAAARDAGQEITTAGVLKLAVAVQRDRRRARKLRDLDAAAGGGEDGGEDEAPGRAYNPRKWRVVAGDCVEGLAKQPAGSARLIFADPPYNQGVDYGGGEKADKLPEYDYLRWCSEWIAQCHRVLADGGSFWLLVSHEYEAALELILRGTLVPSEKSGSGFEVVFQDVPGAALSAPTGFHVRSWVTWYESFGVNCANNFNRCSRRLFYCVKDPKDFTFYPEAFTRPSDREAKYGDKRAAPGGKLWDDVWGIKPPIPRLTGTCAERLPDFPTQLPLKLVTPIVLGCSDPGDLVLDPFSGSATTGEAAITNGRRYLGFESSPKFAGLSRKRLHAAEAKCGSRAG
jgi:site-specific DNA-methyltransferase (adenine-specific)